MITDNPHSLWEGSWCFLLQRERPTTTGSRMFLCLHESEKRRLMLSTGLPRAGNLLCTKSTTLAAADKCFRNQCSSFLVKLNDQVIFYCTSLPKVKRHFFLPIYCPNYFLPEDILSQLLRPPHPAPDRAASRSSILSVAFFGTMMHLRGASLTQRRLFWPGKFLFSSEALNFWAPLS